MDELESRYQEALDYLYSFVDYSLTRNLRNLPEKFDLSRMVELMALLGNPQEQYKIFHVAGTKGKGSTSAFIAAACQAQGYKVGFYTSPHLSDYTERIQINREPISHAEFCDLVDEIRPAIAQVEKITTFEMTTALAFLAFAHHGVDVVVAEVGLGGRLDATNVVNPLVSVITSLSYDHMNVLGDTLAQIAGEKAGIIKPGRPVVVSPQKPDAQKVVEDTARSRGCEVTLVGREIHFAPETHSLDGQTFTVWQAQDQLKEDRFIEQGGRADWSPLSLSIPLLGHHQVENAVTAYAAILTARQEGLEISDDAVRAGFAQVSWPGRFEILRRYAPVIIDSAHNRDSALKLRLAIDDYLPGQPVILLFGASEDKDITGMFAELMPRVKRVIATQSVHPRAMEANKLVELAHQYGVQAEAVMPLEDGLVRALDLAGSEAVVLATGSIFVAAAVRDAWFALPPEKREPVLFDHKKGMTA